MAFPATPTNGQTFTENGINYTYQSSSNVWMKTSTLSGSSSNLATFTGNNNIVGGGAINSNPILTLKNDVASPGNNKVYKTDINGNVGWGDIPKTFTQAPFTVAPYGVRIYNTAWYTFPYGANRGTFITNRFNGAVNPGAVGATVIQFSASTGPVGEGGFQFYPGYRFFLTVTLKVADSTNGTQNSVGAILSLYDHTDSREIMTGATDTNGYWMATAVLDGTNWTQIHNIAVRHMESSPITRVYGYFGSMGAYPIV